MLVSLDGVRYSALVLYAKLQSFAFISKYCFLCAMLLDTQNAYVEAGANLVLRIHI